MVMNNWKRFSGGKGNGVQRMSTSKKTTTGGRNQGSKKMGAKKGGGKKSKKSRSDKAIVPTEALERKWQAEQDARTLMEASHILESDSRVSRAKKVAEEQAKVAREAAEAINHL